MANLEGEEKMTVTLVLDFYDDRIGWQISGGGIFHGGSHTTEVDAIRRAGNDMIDVNKNPNTLKIIRNEHRKSAKLDRFC